MRDKRSPLLQLSLAISIVANVILLVRLYDPTFINDLRTAFQSPPAVVAADHVLGRPDARTTIVVYMDFQCPFCARFHESLLALTRTASVRVIYRHFPLDGHPFAFKAAEASECANEQGKFWQYGDALFEHQRGMNNDTFSELATSLGLNVNEFQTCLASDRHKQRILANRADGLRRHIFGTPVVFIDGKRFNGVVPEATLEKIIQRDSIS